MPTINLKIKGMNCSACEKIITEDLSELAGVSEIKINATAGSGSLNMDEALVKPEQILAVIKNAGFTAEVVE
jgi:copper chaperone CopZ